MYLKSTKRKGCTSAWPTELYLTWPAGKRTGGARAHGICFSILILSMKDSKKNVFLVLNTGVRRNCLKKIENENNLCIRKILMKNERAEITGLGYFIANPFTRGGIGVSAFLGWGGLLVLSGFS